jgi:hypothetical protein
MENLSLRFLFGEAEIGEGTAKSSSASEGLSLRFVVLIDRADISRRFFECLEIEM